MSGEARTRLHLLIMTVGRAIHPAAATVDRRARPVMAAAAVGVATDEPGIDLLA